MGWEEEKEGEKGVGEQEREQDREEEIDKLSHGGKDRERSTTENIRSGASS